MKILHVAYSLGESSAATRLAQSQVESHLIYFLLGRPSRFPFVRNRQIYVRQLQLLSILFRVWEKVLCYASNIIEGEMFSFGTHSALQGFALRKLIRSYGIERVHLHWGGVGFMPLTALSGLNVPVVITAHDYHFFTGGCHVPMGCEQINNGCYACPLTSSSMAKRYIAKNMSRNSKILRSLDLTVVAPSHYTKETVANAHPRVHVEVVPNSLGSFHDLDGRSVDCLFETYEAHRSADSDMKCIVAVGVNETPRQNKGQDILVRTLQDLKEKHYRIKLITIGEYYEVEGVFEHVHVPSASSAELMQWYAIADLCLVPSRYETFSQVTLEAIVCGTPVVAFGLTGPRDIIDDLVSGYLVPPFDQDAFAEVVEIALNHKKDNALQMTKSAVKALKDYSPIVISGKHDGVYRNSRLNREL